ncbi:hypothetical protein OF83DRAFT_1137466 [Amylostereum chailletii]|nr:hypothetical protein OF83DRAFT_1137466 [Amylostereum chailletii]
MLYSLHGTTVVGEVTCILGHVQWTNLGGRNFENLPGSLYNIENEFARKKKVALTIPIKLIFFQK